MKSLIHANMKINEILQYYPQTRSVFESHGLAGSLCPDHFFIANIEQALQWSHRCGFDLLISESAGLCNRCSPHITDVLAVCVIDHLSGVHTPRKIGPMLKSADIVVLTKGDIVSQAERVFRSYKSEWMPSKGYSTFSEAKKTLVNT